eukprot:gene1762-531_t
MIKAEYFYEITHNDPKCGTKPPLAVPTTELKKCILNSHSGDYSIITRNSTHAITKFNCNKKCSKCKSGFATKIGCRTLSNGRLSVETFVGKPRLGPSGFIYNLYKERDCKIPLAGSMIYFNETCVDGRAWGSRKIFWHTTRKTAEFISYKEKECGLPATDRKFYSPDRCYRIINDESITITKY